MRYGDLIVVHAEVSYMYSVSGRSFIGNQISFGHLTVGTGSRQIAR